MVKVIAPAKLNFLLDIIGLDERNYHLMEMIMQTIDIFDTITIDKRTDNLITLECDDKSIPCDERNICYKCAKLFLEKANIQTGVNINIEKVIPQQAGMAGGSADGAGVLVGLNELFKTDYTIQDLCDIGVKVGADIPFCLVGGTAKVEGIGEKITKISEFKGYDIVVVKPQVGISTKEAFDTFDKQNIKPRNNIDSMVKAIEQNDINLFCKNMYNALEFVSGVKEISEIEQIMIENKAKGALMTGSGSAVFGIFDNTESAKNCKELLLKKYSQTYLCHTVNHGAKVIK